MALPDRADARPEPLVEMPRPTVWPFVLSLGLALAATGAALATTALAALGGLLFVVGLVGWMGELLPGRGVEFEPTGRPLPAPVAARPGTVEELKPGTPGYRFRLPVKMHPISAGIKGGAAGGLVMPIPALLWGVLSGHGIWFPVNLLAGVALPGVGALSVPELEQFRPVLFGLAVAVHAVMSLVIGLVYGVLLPTIPGDRWWHLLTGGVVIPVVWTGFSYAMMGVANPPLERHVDWVSFAAAQLVFGLVAAVVVSRTEKVPVRPAGPGRPADPVVPALLFLALAGLASGCDAPGKPHPPTDPDRPGEVRDFAALYQKNCAGCHGADGNLGPAPPLNDRLFLHLVPGAELLRVITDGRPGTPMPPFDRAKGGPLTTAQVKILADGLKTTWGGASAAPTDAPPYTADAAGDAGRGATAFARACAGCHGDAGRGGTFDGRPIGAIRVPAYLALSSDQVLRRYVITGRPDLGMPDYAGGTGRPPGFRPLTSQDVTDLTALLASWRK
jgi:mono/diheme cytochrome c family protein